MTGNQTALLRDSETVPAAVKRLADRLRSSGWPTGCVRRRRQARRHCNGSCMKRDSGRAYSMNSRHRRAHAGRTICLRTLDRTHRCGWPLPPSWRSPVAASLLHRCGGKQVLAVW